MKSLIAKLFAGCRRYFPAAPIRRSLPVRARIEFQENLWRAHFADAIATGLDRAQAARYATLQQQRRNGRG